MRPILFLLKSGFSDGESGPFFCPDTAYVEGFLSYAPELADHLDIRRIEFEKPRSEIVNILGAPNQSCPVYIFPEGENVPADAQMSPLTARMFISDARHIVSYLAMHFKAMKPHG